MILLLLPYIHNSKPRKQVDVGRKHLKKATTERKACDTVLVVNSNSRSRLTGKDWDSFFLRMKEILGENVEVAFYKKSGEGTILANDF